MGTVDNDYNPEESGGDDTPIHEVSIPSPYDDFSEAYGELLQLVDEGVIVVVDTATELTDYEDGDHDGVVAFVTNDGEEEEDAEFYVSSNGTFDGPFQLGGFDEDDKDELREEFVESDGDTMEGDLDMDNNDVNNVGTVDADRVETESLILPTR